MPPAFQVVYSGNVQDAVKDLVARSFQVGPDFGKKVGEAVKQIDYLLHEKARDFGEPCYFLRHVKLQVRLGVVGPVSVEYGVHATEQTVFVSKFNLLTPS